MIKTLGRALPLLLAATGFSLTFAGAQTLPWPDAPGAHPGGPPMAAPMAAPPAPQAPPQGGPSEQCVREFTALRGTTEKLGAAARAAGQRKVPRDEMCKHVTAFATAEGKWVKFVNDNGAKCGIPPQIVKQLQEAHNHTMVARKNICTAGPGPGAPAAPTLSDALGTSRMPLPEGSQSGRGTLDTLTGNAIAR